MALVMAAFLTACGGGGLGLNPDPAVKKAVDVRLVTVKRFTEIEGDSNSEDEKAKEAAREADKDLYYGGKVRVTITGTNLDTDLTVRFPACSGLTESSGGTDVKRVYTCTLSKVGYLPITVVTTAELSLLWFSKVPIPYPQVTMYTSLGQIILELNPEKAPATVDNFLRYMREGFYSKTIFHRVISTNAILAGMLDEKMQPLPTHEPIELENTGMSNLRGTIAMASATAQFLINVADNQFLNTQDGGYPVFGNVISEMNVLDTIKAVETKKVGTYTEVPATPITITRVEQTK